MSSRRVLAVLAVLVAVLEARPCSYHRRRLPTHTHAFLAMVGRTARPFQLDDNQWKNVGLGGGHDRVGYCPFRLGLSGAEAPYYVEVTCDYALIPSNFQANCRSTYLTDYPNVGTGCILADSEVPTATESDRPLECCSRTSHRRDRTQAQPRSWGYWTRDLQPAACTGTEHHSYIRTSIRAQHVSNAGPEHAASTRETVVKMGVGDRRPSLNRADAVQSAIGSFGRWQLGIALAVALSGLPGAWFKVGIVFLAPPVDFWCVAPDPGPSNGSARLNKCTVPGAPGAGAGEQPCTEWQYDRSIFRQTIITEWDLVCDRAQLSNVVQMLFMLGFLVGCSVGGVVADKYGRKPPLLAGSALQLVAGVGCALVPWFGAYLALRFLSAVAVGAITVTGFVIMIEIIGGKWRIPMNVLGSLPFSVGHCLLAGMAYMLRDWRSLQLAVSIPVVLQLSYYWIVPESPRWLLAVGKEEAAVEVLKKGAAANGRPQPDWDKTIAAFRETQEAVDPNAPKPGFLSLFRTPVMRTCTLVMYANWVACGLVFYGLVQYMGQVAGNIFLNNFLSGVLELPGMAICVVALVKWGRRRTLIASQLCAGLSCLSIVMVPVLGLPDWVPVVLASCGVMSITVSFPCVYIYTAELYPTIVRNIGVGSASTIARVGSMVAPFVATLNTVSPTLPPLIFGSIPFATGLLVFMLPETIHRELPDTIAEVESWGKKKAPNQSKKEKLSTVIGGEDNPTFTGND